MDKFSRQVERNLEGIELEKADRVDGAVKLYEENIKENFEGDHPYDRLAVIYRGRRKINDEIRILEKAVWVFENIVYKERLDRLPKLQKFKKRLDDARKLKRNSSV